LAGTLLFIEEIRQSATLFWFGLGVGILQIFFSRTIVDFPHFWRLFGGKDCDLCPYNPPVKKVGELEVFLDDAAENFELFSNIQDKN
jgi:hypothetical protein